MNESAESKIHKLKKEIKDLHDLKWEIIQDNWNDPERFKINDDIDIKLKEIKHLEGLREMNELEKLKKDLSNRSHLIESIVSDNSVDNSYLNNHSDEEITCGEIWDKAYEIATDYVINQMKGSHVDDMDEHWSGIKNIEFPDINHIFVNFLIESRFGFYKTKDIYILQYDDIIDNLMVPLSVPTEIMNGACEKFVNYLKKYDIPVSVR